MLSQFAHNQQFWYKSDQKHFQHCTVAGVQHSSALNCCTVQDFIQLLCARFDSTAPSCRWTESRPFLRWSPARNYPTTTKYKYNVVFTIYNVLHTIPARNYPTTSTVAATSASKQIKNLFVAPPLGDYRSHHTFFEHVRVLLKWPIWWAA